MDFESVLNFNIVVIGHGQFGYTLFDRLTNLGINTFHLSHNQKIPTNIDIVFNCVPAKFQKSLIESQREDGSIDQNTIIVDTSQKVCSSALKDEKTNYAKAFGDISAYDLAEINRQSKQSFVYAKTSDDFNKIAALAKMINIEAIYISPRTRNLSKVLSTRYDRNFPNSLCASIFSGIVFLLCYAYMFIRACPPLGHHNFDDMIMHEFSNICAWVSITLFSAVFVFGSCARFMSKPLKSKTLIKLLNARAQIGLYAAAFAFIHVLCIIIEFQPSMFHRYFYDDSNNMQWWAQLELVFGVLASLFIIPMVISSFSGQWSRKEWFILQPVCGFLVLIFAGSHVTIVGVPPNKSGWRDLFGGPGHLPSPSFWSALAAYLAIFLKLVTFLYDKSCGLPKDMGLQGYMEVKSGGNEEQNKGFEGDCV